MKIYQYEVVFAMNMESLKIAVGNYSPQWIPVGRPVVDNTGEDIVLVQVLKKKVTK